MKPQQFGKPDVKLSWIIEADTYAKEHYKVTLDTEKGKLQLVNTILMLLDQGNEIRIGTDGYCLILESNMAEAEYTDACYQYIDDQHFVGELTKDGNYPDYYPEVVSDVIKNVIDIMADNLPQSVSEEFAEAEKEIYEQYSNYLKKENADE